MSVQGPARRHAARPRPGGDQWGVAAVEMALVLPILIFLLLGIIEVANILRMQMLLNSAVAVVSREVSQDPNITDESDAQSYFSSNLGKLLPSVQQNKDSGDAAEPPAMSMSPTTKPACEETPCTPFLISVNYTYQAMSPIMKPFFDGLTLSATAKRTSEPRSGSILAEDQ